jgi:hypothetical protein
MRSGFVWCLALLVTGCGRLSLEPNTKQSFEVLVRVTTPLTQPVKGAQILLDNKAIGATSDQGTSVLKFVANEGESYDLAVQCPQGLQSPAKPIRVTLRKLADSKRPEFSALCAPSSQVVVVAVRAEGGPNLPVLYLGNEIGRTDASGAANVALRLPPNESFELKLGTTEPDGKMLQPENPVASFTVKDRDEILQFEQKFSRLKKAVIAAPKAKGPIKLGGKG